jgi:hypothetical protein
VGHELRLPSETIFADTVGNNSIKRGLLLKPYPNHGLSILIEVEHYLLRLGRQQQRNHELLLVGINILSKLLLESLSG